MIDSGFHRRLQAWLITVVAQEVKDDVAREGSGLEVTQERVSFELLSGCRVQPDVELPAGHFTYPLDSSAIL
jgi:hypothetical protein